MDFSLIKGRVRPAVGSKRNVAINSVITVLWFTVGLHYEHKVAYS